jgi:hypothetical protein
MQPEGRMAPRSGRLAQPQNGLPARLADRRNHDVGDATLAGAAKHGGAIRLEQDIIEMAMRVDHRLVFATTASRAIDGYE